MDFSPRFPADLDQLEDFSKLDEDMDCKEANAIPRYNEYDPSHIPLRTGDMKRGMALASWRSAPWPVVLSRLVLVAEWGSWVGSQFSAPSVKSGDSLRFRFAEF